MSLFRKISGRNLQHKNPKKYLTIFICIIIMYVCSLKISSHPFSSWMLLTVTYFPKTLIWKEWCTPMFPAALITIAKVWKQPKCPSKDERECCIYTICVYTYTNTIYVYICNIHTQTME